MTPTQRTLLACREAECEVRPPWEQRGVPLVTKAEGCTKYEQTRDFLGFIDILVHCPPVTIGIQATTSGNVSARVRKICTQRAHNAWYWLACGNTIEVWGWRKYAEPVNGKWWRPRIVDVTMEDLHLA